jgi:hypothetical protein
MISCSTSILSGKILIMVVQNWLISTNIEILPTKDETEERSNNAEIKWHHPHMRLMSLRNRQPPHWVGRIPFGLIANNSLKNRGLLYYSSSVVSEAKCSDRQFIQHDVFRITAGIIYRYIEINIKETRVNMKIYYTHVFQGEKRNKMWYFGQFRHDSVVLNLRKHSNRLINSFVNLSWQLSFN